jgi:hypothetical protein
MKDSNHVKLDRILTPNDPTDLLNTTWSAIIETQALFEVLTTAGQEHFGQAASTPFVTGPIASKFGPFADNEYCAAILNGTFDLTGIDEITEVHDIIHGMRYPDPSNPTPPIDITITTETSVTPSNTLANAPPPRPRVDTMGTTVLSSATNSSLVPSPPWPTTASCGASHSHIGKRSPNR